MFIIRDLLEVKSQVDQKQQESKDTRLDTRTQATENRHTHNDVACHEFFGNMHA